MIQTQSSPRSEGRSVICEDYYSFHLLAQQTKLYTDGEDKMLGKVRLNNIYSVNRPALKEASTMVKGKPRGTWYICQVNDVKHEGCSRRESVVENMGFSYSKTERR